MPTINDAFINAILADACYVDNLVPGMTGQDLKEKLEGRMTEELSDFIGQNFEVKNQAAGFASSFEATVWQGKQGTAYAGQVYVSMRGTQETTDFVVDADLAISGLAHAQLVDMVNWWLRETTPANVAALQIGLRVTTQPSTPPLVLQDFVAAESVLGTGNLAGLGSIKSVNGHSLGGYLASAFIRLLGNQQPPIEINTFNSAGFSVPAIGLLPVPLTPT